MNILIIVSDDGREDNITTKMVCEKSFDPQLNLVVLGLQEETTALNKAYMQDVCTLMERDGIKKPTMKQLLEYSRLVPLSCMKTVQFQSNQLPGQSRS